MKENFFVEFNNLKIEQKQLMETLKEIWKNKGNKVKDIKSVDLYYKPEENTCYYVINGEDTGKFSI